MRRLASGSVSGWLRIGQYILPARFGTTVREPSRPNPPASFPRGPPAVLGHPSSLLAQHVPCPGSAGSSLAPSTGTQCYHHRLHSFPCEPSHYCSHCQILGHTLHSYSVFRLRRQPGRLLLAWLALYRGRPTLSTTLLHLAGLCVCAALHPSTAGLHPCRPCFCVTAPASLRCFCLLLPQPGSLLSLALHPGLLSWLPVPPGGAPLPRTVLGAHWSASLRCASRSLLSL